MNCIINGACGLFAAPTQCAAITLAVVAFVAGVLATSIVCRLCRGCGCKSGKAQSRQGARPQQAPRRVEQPFEKRKPHPAPADGSVEIYVGNLSYDMTEDQLRAEFEAFGKVNSTRLVMDRFNGKSKGFGFVQMPNRDEAERACAAINEKEIMGRRVKCNEAKNLI